ARTWPDQTSDQTGWPLSDGSTGTTGWRESASHPVVHRIQPGLPGRNQAGWLHSWNHFRCHSAAVDVQARKEEGDFSGGGFSGIRAVHGIGIDAVSEVGADGAGSSLLRIGGAHQVAVLGDGAFTFEHLHE